MACRVTDQQKKRSADLCRQYKPTKKKKSDFSDCMLNLRSCAYTKKVQVGISWRDMAPYLESVPASRFGLANTIQIPREIFDLDNLNDVLSHEVWDTLLTESERKLLNQFLPDGIEAEQVVSPLLSGENHHFGNPFLKWSKLLCSGNLHPNVVLRVSHQHRINRMAYYPELMKYHFSMIDLLCRWKERWNSCNDIEKLLREGPTVHKQICFPNSTMRVKERSSNSTKRVDGSFPNSTRRFKAAPKSEMPPTICIRLFDCANQMSHIKISSEQYQLIKNLKPSGGHISYKSLCNVLGDIKGFHACKNYEKEEKRMHENWVKLATKDIPAAFEYFRGKKLHKEQWGKSLEQELAMKKISNMDTDEKTEKFGQVNMGPKGHGEHHMDRILFLDARQGLNSMNPDQKLINEITPEVAENSQPLQHLYMKMNTNAFTNRRSPGQYSFQTECNMNSSPNDVSCSEQFMQERNFIRDVSPTNGIYGKFARAKITSSFDRVGSSHGFSLNLNSGFSLNQNPGLLYNS